MLAAQNSNISIIPKEVVLLVFLSKKKKKNQKTKPLWDTAEVWPAAFYPKIICIQWKVVQVWGPLKTPPASIRDTRGKHCWVGKAFDCPSLISSQSGHSLCLFIPVLLLWNDFFLIPSWDSAPSPSGWVFFHTSKQFSDTTRWVSYNLTYFWYYLPEDTIGSHRWELNPTRPPTSSHFTGPS